MVDYDLPMPLSEVPFGSHFRIVTLPNRLLFKCEDGIALTEQCRMVLLRPDVECIIDPRIARRQSAVDVLPRPGF